MARLTQKHKRTIKRIRAKEGDEGVKRYLEGIFDVRYQRLGDTNGGEDK